MKTDPVSLARRILAEAGHFEVCRLRPQVNLGWLLRHLGLDWRRWSLGGLAGALVQIEGRWYVVTDSRQAAGRQRFTAAHELKHFLADRPQIHVFPPRASADTQIEREADVFARELLMPDESVSWLWRQGLRSPVEIARALGVSSEAAGIRLAELGLGERRLWSN